MYCFLSDEGQDYNVPTPPTVTFTTGAMNGAIECLNITLIDDDNYEGNHSFTAEIDSIVPATLDIDISNSSATILILDNNGEIF